MKTKLILFALIISFAAAFGQQKVKLQKADESGFIEVDKLPELKEPLKPHYPEIARLAGIEGTVYLKILVNENGDVEKAKVEQGAKDMLDNSALEAAKKAKFTPAILNDKPVKVWVILPVAFKLGVEREDEEVSKKVESGEKGEPGINEFVKVEKLPEMIEAAKPEYPEAAKKAGITAKVFVKVLVGKDGLPKKAVVIKTGNEIFNQSAIDAAMKSKFTPAINNGEKIAVWVVLPYKYDLDGKTKGETELFDSSEKAKEYYKGFTALYETSPEQRARIGNIDKGIKFERLVGKVSFGDESCLYKVTKAKKTLYNFIARLNNKIYKYAGASSIRDIQKYVDDMKKSNVLNEIPNLPDITWLVTPKDQDFPLIAVEKKLEGIVSYRVNFDKEMSISKMELIKGVNETLDKEALKYIKKNYKTILNFFESAHQKYIKQHPDQPKGESVKDVAIIRIDYKIDE